MSISTIPPKLSREEIIAIAIDSDLHCVMDVDIDFRNIERFYNKIYEQITNTAPLSAPK